MHDSLLPIICYTVLYTAIITMIVVLSSNNRSIQVLLYWIMPFILTPLLIMYPDPNYDPNKAFNLVTMYGILIGSWIIQLCRHKYKPLYASILYLFWIMTIGGATYFDFRNIYFNQNLFPFNSLCGIIILLTTPLPDKIRLNDNDKNNNLNWMMSLLFIIVNTIWDTVNGYDFYCFREVIKCIYHLGIPLIIIFLIKKKHHEWIQYRVYSLCIYKWINTLPFLKYNLPYWDLSGLSCEYDDMSNKFKISIQIISFLFGIVLFIKTFKKYFKNINISILHLWNIIEGILNCSITISLMIYPQLLDVFNNNKHNEFIEYDYKIVQMTTAALSLFGVIYLLFGVESVLSKYLMATTDRNNNIIIYFSICSIIWRTTISPLLWITVLLTFGSEIKIIQILSVIFITADITSALGTIMVLRKFAKKIM